MIKNKEKTLDILLIDDNQDDVLLVKLAAKECNIGGEFLVVNNGKSAILLLETLVSDEKNLPDLIILDINIPKINGIEVLRYIKSNEFIKSIPTIVFTSSDSVTDMKYCYESGADLYLRKPNNIEGFREIMKYIKSFCF